MNIECLNCKGVGKSVFLGRERCSYCGSSLILPTGKKKHDPRTCKTCVHYVKNRCEVRVEHGVVYGAQYGHTFCSFRRATDAEMTVKKSESMQNAEAN